MAIEISRSHKPDGRCRGVLGLAGETQPGKQPRRRRSSRGAQMRYLGPPQGVGCLGSIGDVGGCWAFCGVRRSFSFFFQQTGLRLPQGERETTIYKGQDQLDGSYRISFSHIQESTQLAAWLARRRGFEGERKTRYALINTGTIFFTTEVVVRNSP